MHWNDCYAIWIELYFSTKQTRQHIQFQNWGNWYKKKTILCDIFIGVLGHNYFSMLIKKKLWFTPMEWNIIFRNNRKSNRRLTDCPNLFWIWLSFAAPTFDLALMLRQAIHADFPIAIASLFSNIWICTILVPSLKINHIFNVMNGIGF